MACWTTKEKAIRTSPPSPIFWSASPPVVRMNFSPGRTICGHARRKLALHSLIPHVSQFPLSRMPQPRQRRLSSRLSATTSCAMNRCNASCSQTTQLRSPLRFRFGWAPREHCGDPAAIWDRASAGRCPSRHDRSHRLPPGPKRLDLCPRLQTRHSDQQAHCTATIYALALSRLTGIKLFDIKCAWFNEHEYCEFFPRALLAQRPRTGRGEMARNSSGPKPAARATAKNTVLDAGNLTRKPNPRRSFRQVSAALPS